MNMGIGCRWRSKGDLCFIWIPSLLTVNKNHIYNCFHLFEILANNKKCSIVVRVGKNIIYRRSYDSNLVTPWTKSIDEYLKGPKHPRSAESCGCGWPTHLYIPKGSHEGMPFDLFVMLTNFDHDYVEENPDSVAVPETCNSPYMYCGVKWRQYPDAKPMGYPFDRLPYAVPLGCPNHPGAPFSTLFCKVLSIFWSRPVSTLEEYVSYAPNMAATVVEIKHLDKLAW